MPKITVTPEYSGMRADSLIANEAGISRAAAQKLIAGGNVTLLSKERLTKSTVLFEGDELLYELPEPVSDKALPQNIPLDIVYEDKNLLVVNKPKGMVVHPAAGNFDGTLVNALLAHCGNSLSGIGGVIRPGIVHRIDKDTSGLLLVAKDDNSHNSLACQIKNHSVTREYEAIVIGYLLQNEGTIDKPIGRHPTERKKMAVTERNSKNAVTHYRVITELNGYSHVCFRLETGRTHQIRVHMASIGHPILGDELYGGARRGFKLNGQTLHAKKIGFIHPETNEYMEFDSPLPEYFEELIKKLS